MLALATAGLSFDGFLGGPNLTSVLERSAFVGIIVVGMTYLIIGGGIDLSVGSVAALAGVVVAKFVEAGIHPLAAARLGDVLALGFRGSEPAPARSPARPSASLIGS